MFGDDCLLQTDINKNIHDPEAVNWTTVQGQSEGEKPEANVVAI